MGLADVRQAIGSAIGTIDGLHVATNLGQAVVVPQAVVWRRDVTYDDTEDGQRTIQFGIRVYVCRVSEKAAADNLDDYAEPDGDKSIKATVEADADLATLVGWVLVQSVAEPQIFTVSDVDYVGQDFTVEVGI